MTDLFQYEPMKDDGLHRCVMGISEWHNWYNPPEEPPPKDDPLRVIDDCIDAHLNREVEHIVWNCGRSVVQYHSELDHATEQDVPRTRPAMQAGCPLRRALDYGRKRDVRILGRLAMNRHYGPDHPAGSDFLAARPEYWERSRDGSPDQTRMCYAIEAVRQERLDILLEIQRVGVDALVLDFCRQMPILGYHEALVDPWRQKTGTDPREIDSLRPGAYSDWFQYRADVLTEFMRELRRQVRDQEDEIGRKCPIIARVPDSPSWLCVAAGLDVERWCAEDLIDGTMLSPFPWAVEDRGHYTEWHVDTAHKHGKFCIGGIGSLDLIRKAADDSSEVLTENYGFFHPKPVFQRAARQYHAGVDAMSLYQSEALVRMPYLVDTINSIGDCAVVHKRVEELEDPVHLSRYGASAASIGLDWHARFVPPNYKMHGHSLGGVVGTAL
jgi:hypothetical protein